MRIPRARGRRPPLLVLVFLTVAGCGGDTDSAGQASSPGEPRGESPSDHPVAEPESPAAPGGNQAELLRGLSAAPGESLLSGAAEMDLEQAFEAVARGIGYEPYTGVLRGAAGTALAGSGNDLDQALLLSEILQRSGYRTRFVRGTLGRDNQLVLLRGMTDPDLPPLDFTAEYAPYDPASDTELLSRTEDHFWVEIFQEPEWLPLDPSFPRAEPGEAYAEAETRFQEVPGELYQRVRIAYLEDTRTEEPRELGVVEGRVVDLSLRPISLSIRGVPQSPAGPVTRGGTPRGITGGIAGALSGGAPKEEEPEEVTEDDLVGLSYRRSLWTTSDESSLPSTFLLEGERDGGLSREWLEIELTGPGLPPLRSTRVLFDSDWMKDVSAEPPPMRRFSVAVVPGPVPRDWLQGERNRWSAILDIPAWKRELEDASEVDPGDGAAELARRLTEMEAAAGTGAGHLMALSYAAESDSLSRLVARSTGVTPVWARPRVLIASFETSEIGPDEAESRVSLDLRIDGVESYPLPGAPSRSSWLFQTARGLQNSVLEGAVVAEATGISVPVTTANLMERADEEMDDALVVVSPQRPDAALSQVQGLPNTCSPLIRDALNRGQEVVLPRRAVRLAGEERWGWWELNPRTGEMVGVMEHGQHQGMAEYKLSLERVGTNDKMGWGIGAIVGATGTLFLISGKMLEYGEVTPKLVAEVKKWLENLLCHSCFSKAEASTSMSSSVSIGGDCFKEDLVKEEAGVSAGISFCEQYEKGFKCTSGLLLAGLLGEDLQSGPSGEASLGFSAGCADWKLSGKADGGGVEIQAGKDKLKVAGGR